MRIAVMTSGGDAPGMNAAIRAVVRVADNDNIDVFGVKNGYKGLCNNEIEQLHPDNVAHILHRGGTILRSTRYPEFKTDRDVRRNAYDNLRARQLTGLVVIGGEGSTRGAYCIYKESRPSVSVVVIPASIDNDIPFTKMTVGADTAIQRALSDIDCIRDTAFSHQRIFVIQVMGRHCEYLPRMIGLAVGAHAIYGPRDTVVISKLVARIKAGFLAGKDFVIIVVAEGLKNVVTMSGETIDLENTRGVPAQTLMELIGEELKNKYPDSVRHLVLGHVQRGGAPSGFDRIVASRMGAAAVRSLKRSVEIRQSIAYMLALQNSKDGVMHDCIQEVPLEDIICKLDECIVYPEWFLKLSDCLVRGLDKPPEPPEKM